MYIQKKKHIPTGEDLIQFERLASESYKRIFRAAWYYAGNYEDAQDIVQETFILAYKAFPNFKHKSSFYTWLYAIFRKVRARMRKQKKLYINRFGAVIEEETGEYSSATHVNPKTFYEKYDALSTLQNVLSTLPEKYREVLILRHLEDFSYNEIALILNCSIGTVKSRIHKARLLLRKKMR